MSEHFMQPKTSESDFPGSTYTYFDEVNARVMEQDQEQPFMVHEAAPADLTQEQLTTLAMCIRATGLGAEVAPVNPDEASSLGLRVYNTQPQKLAKLLRKLEQK